ncbi:MAG: hypothetical protein LBQ38_11880 [Spirochaetaceae bacterium]|jgi:hypothetical protein|nr:hypothetical protein [Spirochaetaceae bacterium]
MKKGSGFGNVPVFLLVSVFFCALLPAYLGAADESAVFLPTVTTPPEWPILFGTGEGLYGMNRFGASMLLWQGSGVRKLLRVGAYWVLLGEKGVMVSRDLLNWESRNDNLPVKTIKLYADGEKSFVSQVQEIKDLEINPQNPDIMVCAVKDMVFLTRNGGRSWESLGMLPYRTNGIKAVASAYLPSASPSTASPPAAGADGLELTVFLSHSTYGVYYLLPDRPGARWTELSAGLERLETTGNPDEVSDIAAAFFGENPAGGSEAAGEGAGVEIYVSQTFRRRVYRLNWATKQFVPLWSDSAGFGTADSLDIGAETFRFVREGEILEMDRPGGSRTGAPPPEPRLPNIAWSKPELVNPVRTFSRRGLSPRCMVIRENGLYPGSEPVNLCELWLLEEGGGEALPGAGAAAAGAEAMPAVTPGEGAPTAAPASEAAAAGGKGAARRALARGRKGLYLPVNRALENKTLSPYLNIIAERGLDMVVIDMKDDYGRLRFSPNTPGIAEKGRVFRPVDIEAFLQTMRERGIYTAARIVVFKDPELARKEGGKYAVWDAQTNKPWAGYYDTKRKKPERPEEPDKNSPFVTEILPSTEPGFEILRTWYDERWVDPYSEEVWEYTAAIARELHERGFDEIQFDYIRFPTDGENLGNARYRWREQGMDMESALLSFLGHVRAKVEAPLSIDIYGANGWYRTGARTGQEVELIAPYVDVICPMYYPSHFEQDFLAQEPAELRPYRIYFQGTQRTSRIARGSIVVRPYVQAFYLNVSYDRKYYNPDYVRRQVEGVRDAGDPGFIYWNNSGRYDDIPLPPEPATLTLSGGDQI